MGNGQLIAASALLLISVAALRAGELPSYNRDLTREPASPTRAQVFPPDNPWNTDISTNAVHPRSEVFINSIGRDKNLHPDFGPLWQGRPNGIPYVVVRGDQPKVPITFSYGGESDPGPYPVPDDAPIEGGPDARGDRHVLVIDRDNHRLYELFKAYKVPGPAGSGWKAGSGAIFDLSTNGLRPKGWTSADAAGLPIFPGLVRYDEVVEKGELTHAVRFTCEKTQRGFISPARHFASSSNDPNLPPMGLRLRLKADYDISNFPKNVQVILRGLKKYGMLLADNGGDWFITGAPDPRWKDEELAAIKRVKGKDLEVVYTGDIEH
jgi:hypothetical protein